METTLLHISSKDRLQTIQMDMTTIFRIKEAGLLLGVMGVMVLRTRLSVTASNHAIVVSQKGLSAPTRGPRRMRNEFWKRREKLLAQLTSAVTSVTVIRSKVVMVSCRVVGAR
jgi:hypothetical protein